MIIIASFPGRPMFFNVAREKSGRPGRFCDVIITYLPPFLPCYAAARPRFELPSNVRLHAHAYVLRYRRAPHRASRAARATSCDATKSRVPVMSVSVVKHRAEAGIYLLGNGEERSRTELLAKAERRCH